MSFLFGLLILAVVYTLFAIVDDIDGPGGFA